MELIGIGPRQCRHIKCRCSKDSLGLIPGPSPAERAHLEESDLICLAGRDAKTFKMRLELCMDAAVHEQIKWRWGHGALLMGVGGGAETLCSHFPMKVDEELIERLRNDDENPSELPPWEALEGLNQFPHAVVVGDHSDETTDKQPFDLEEHIPHLFGITWWHLQNGGGLVWSTTGLVEPVRRWLTCVEKVDAAAAETRLSWFTPPPRSTGILVALGQAGLESQEALRRQRSRAVMAQHDRERAEEEVVLANLESEVQESAENRAACASLINEGRLLYNSGDSAGALVRYRLATGKDRFNAEAHAWRSRAALRLANELAEDERKRQLAAETDAESAKAKAEEEAREAAGKATEALGAIRVGEDDAGEATVDAHTDDPAPAAGGDDGGRQRQQQQGEEEEGGEHEQEDKHAASKCREGDAEEGEGARKAKPEAGREGMQKKAAEEASGGSDVNLAVGTESKLEMEAESAVKRPYIRGQESLHVTREDMVLENEQYDGMSLQGKRGVELSVEIKKAAQAAEEARLLTNRMAILEEAVSAANSALVQSGGKDGAAWVLRANAFLMAGSQLEATLDFAEGTRADPKHKHCRDLWLDWQDRNKEIRRHRLKLDRTWEAMGALEELRSTSKAISVALDKLVDWPISPLATWQWHTLLYSKPAPAPPNTLTHLTIEDMPVGPDGAEVMAKALARNGTLERLVVRSCRLRPEGVQSLAKALVSNTHLLALDLSYNAARDAGAKALWCAMGVNKRLEELTLRGNFIRCTGVEELHVALTPEDSPLIKIDLGGNLLEWPGARHIAKAMHSNRTLEEFGLSGCARLASDAVHRLSVVALEHPRMRRLDLRGAHISRTAVMRLRRRAKRRRCEIALAIDNVTVLSTEDSDDDEPLGPVLWDVTDAPDPDDLDAIDVDDEPSPVDPATAVVLHPTKALPDERPCRGLVMEDSPDDKLDHLGVATRDLF